MKVAVACESPLLQRSLELFLDKNLSSLKQCDLVLRDKRVMDSHQSLFISDSAEADIKKPFSKTQLYIALENFYQKMEDIQIIQSEVQHIEEESSKDFSLLEERIDQLTDEYKKSLLRVVKAFYE
jgi:serine/threonine protein kinase HipA of HipAB toxin-antitoxin module